MILKIQVQPSSSFPYQILSLTRNLVGITDLYVKNFMINLFIFKIRNIIFIWTINKLIMKIFFYLCQLHSLKLFTSSQRPTEREKKEISIKYKYPFVFYGYHNNQREILFEKKMKIYFLSCQRNCSYAITKFFFKHIFKILGNIYFIFMVKVHYLNFCFN